MISATTSVGIFHCGNKHQGGASSAAHGPQEITKKVVPCGFRLQEKYPMMLIAIMGILLAEQTSWGRKITDRTGQHATS